MSRIHGMTTRARTTAGQHRNGFAVIGSCRGCAAPRPAGNDPAVARRAKAPHSARLRHRPSVHSVRRLPLQHSCIDDDIGCPRPIRAACSRDVTASSRRPSVTCSRPVRNCCRARTAAKDSVSGDRSARSARADCCSRRNRSSSAWRSSKRPADSEIRLAGLFKKSPVDELRAP